MLSWSPDDVKHWWSESLGDEYKNFISLIDECYIDGEILIGLTKEDLRELNIENENQINFILEKIKETQQNESMKTEIQNEPIITDEKFESFETSHDDASNASVKKEEEKFLTEDESYSNIDDDTSVFTIDENFDENKNTKVENIDKNLAFDTLFQSITSQTDRDGFAATKHLFDDQKLEYLKKKNLEINAKMTKNPKLTEKVKMQVHNIVNKSSKENPELAKLIGNQSFKNEKAILDKLDPNAKPDVELLKEEHLARRRKYANIQLMQKSREDFEAPPTNEMQGDNDNKKQKKNLMNSQKTIQKGSLDDTVERNLIMKQLNTEELLHKAHDDIMQECRRKQSSVTLTPKKVNKLREFRKYNSPRHGDISTHMVEMAPNLVQTPSRASSSKQSESREQNIQLLNERLSKKKKIQGRGHYNLKNKHGQTLGHSEEYLYNQQLLQQEFNYGQHAQAAYSQQSRSQSQRSFYQPSCQSGFIIGQEPSHIKQKENHDSRNGQFSTLPKIDDNDKEIEEEIQSAFEERVKMLSGRIPFHEFEIALKRLNIVLERRMVRALYQKYKIDGVGISYEAFQEVVKEYSESNGANFTPYSEKSRGSPLRSYSAHQSRFAPPTHSAMKDHDKVNESFSSTVFMNNPSSHYYPKPGSTVASSYFSHLKKGHHAHTPGSSIASSYFSQIKKCPRTAYAPSLSTISSATSLSITCNHTRPTFELNVTRIEPVVKIVVPQISQKKYHPSMLIIPKVKEYMKPKTRDEQRTDIIKKLLKDQDGPSQLGEMNDKKFKRLKDDKDKKGKMAHSEKVYRTREDEKNQIKMKRRDRNTQRLAYDSMHYSGVKFSKQNEFIEFKNLFDTSKMTKDDPTTRDRRLRSILSKDIDSLASPNTKESFHDKMVILMRGFKQYMSKEALYLEECRILVYQLWLGIEKYIETKEFGDGDLSKELNLKVFRNINSQWLVLNKHHPEITNPTEEFKHCVLCVMLVLGQKKINWITAYKNVLTHQEFPIIMKNCTVFNVSSFSFHNYREYKKTHAVNTEVPDPYNRQLITTIKLWLNAMETSYLLEYQMKNKKAVRKHKRYQWQIIRNNARKNYYLFESLAKNDVGQARWLQCLF